MNVIDELTANLPCFAINGSNITVIDEPQQFYETLISLTRNARQKIVISTLYFGNGIREQALIDELRNALNNNHLLRVNILVDFLRGTRDGPENSSTQLLKTLANRATVHLYHTPNLRGLLKKCLPSRINEITGIQHMKLYIFDNNIILSGANLSETYFTNRQDRYVLIRNCAPLINFFEKLVDIISSFSFVLRPDGGIDTCNNDHPYESDELEFKARVNEKLNLLQKSFLRDQQSSIQPDDEHDTILYPIIQMGLFCINQEREFLTRLLSNKEIGSRLIISSGYFNLLDEYENALSSVTHDLDIIYASPKANGFHDGSGLAGYIPSIYVDISKNFWEKCRPKTNLYEYSRMDWSYHAKGIWFTLPNSPLMCTLVGSSNYGYRSTYRDLEAQLLIVTRNPELKVRLGKEINRLKEFCDPVESSTFMRADHVVPCFIRLLARGIRNFF